jgi:hypothetical protein
LEVNQANAIASAQLADLAQAPKSVVFFIKITEAVSPVVHSIG